MLNLIRLPSLEAQFAGLACCWRGDGVGRVSRRWVVHLRWPSLLLHSPVRLLPGRKFRSILRPANQSGFVTPVKQLSHCRSVGLCKHERLHRFLRRPNRARPERLGAILQQFDREDAVGPHSLAGNSQRLKKERGEIEPRPNAKTRNGDDWHKSSINDPHRDVSQSSARTSLCPYADF